MNVSKKAYLLAVLAALVTLVIASFLVAGQAAGVVTRAAPAPEVGMAVGQRYHAVHVDSLQLRCETCHSNAASDYQDPMAQVSNPVDKKACLSCHGPGSAQPFYGDEWQKAKVSR